MITPTPAISDHASQGGGSLQRTTVNLTPRSVDALAMAGKLTGDSKTDVINRAIQVYAYLQEIVSNGGSLYARDSGQAELERLRFI